MNEHERSIRLICIQVGVSLLDLNTITRTLVCGKILGSFSPLKYGVYFILIVPSQSIPTE